MPSSKRQPGRRVGWARLSPAYRTRLERRGIGRAYWEGGGDLRVARGHAPSPPRGAAPFDATMRYVTGQGTDDDAATLSRFVEASKPRWLPDGLSFDVVGALSQLRGTPRDWAGVRFVPSRDGEPWAMVVTPKGATRRDDGTSAYDQLILIPGGGAPGTGAREVLDLFYHPEASGVAVGDPRWRGWTSGRVGVAKRGGGGMSEPSVGYGERSEVLGEIERLLAEWREAT